MAAKSRDRGTLKDPKKIPTKQKIEGCFAELWSKMEDVENFYLGIQRGAACRNGRDLFLRRLR